MSDEKHSPGPWHIDGYRVIDRNYNDVVALGPGAGRFGTTDDANSRLIAAAPEMLALLRECLDVVRLADGVSDREGLEVSLMDLIARIDGQR